jgi:ketosteroid isomerase-like protein
MESAIVTRTNLQIIQQAFDDFSKGNIGAIVNACSDDVVWGSYKIPDVPMSGLFYGKEGVQEFFTELGANVHYSFFAPKEFITQGDRVVVLGHHTGTVTKTGKSFDHDWCFTFKMNNGKVQNYFAYTDSREQALAFK